MLQPQAILANNVFGVVGAPEPAIEGNTFVIGGPGDFVLEAGRNLGPFMPSVNVLSQYGTLISGEPANVSVQQSFGGGIISVGNQWDPYLPAAGASLTVMFGVGKGEDLDALRDAYVAPGTAANALGGYSATLLNWMQQNEAAELMTEFGTSNVTADQAYAAFVALPEVRQEVFLIRDVYFNELRATADTSSPSYKQYSRGYAAVNTLFPASLGYTSNNLTGGLGSSGSLVTTGDLDLRLATIQTQQGGDIDILGPGGRVVAGSTVATAAQAARRTSDDARLYSGGVAPYGVPAKIESIPAGYEGVLTLRGGEYRHVHRQRFHPEPEPSVHGAGRQHPDVVVERRSQCRAGAEDQRQLPADRGACRPEWCCHGRSGRRRHRRRHRVVADHAGLAAGRCVPDRAARYRGRWRCRRTRLR